eukprot:1291654-Prymnesium_polylepis.1
MPAKGTELGPSACSQSCGDSQRCGDARGCAQESSSLSSKGGKDVSSDETRDRSASGGESKPSALKRMSSDVSEADTTSSHRVSYREALDD